MADASWITIDNHWGKCLATVTGPWLHASDFQAFRFFVWSPSPDERGPTPTYPAGGGDVDGVAQGFSWDYSDRIPPGTSGSASMLVCAQPGWPFLVEAGSAFGAGVLLAAAFDGRAVVDNAGTVAVARSLEASSAAGQLVACVFTSGR